MAGNQIKIWLRENYQITVLAVLAFVFFFFYSWLAFSTPLKFNSPDETANYFFIRQFVETGAPRYLEPLNSYFGGIFHPRSSNVVGSFIVPGSFLGLTLIYGALAKSIGLGLVPFLSPLISVIAVLFFYGIIKNIFDDLIAFVSVILFFLHPAFFYYSSRGLFNNALFLDLLIIGLYWVINSNRDSNKDSNRDSNTFPSSAVLRRVDKYHSNNTKPLWCYVLAGLFIGLGLIARPVEALWVGPILIVLAVLYRRQINWFGAILFVLTLAATIIPVLYYNQSLYGSPWATGYATIVSPPTTLPQVYKENLANTEIASKDFTIPILLPFGFHPRTMIKNFYHYGVEMFWWLFLTLIFGLYLVLKNWKQLTREQKLFLYFYFFIFLFLAIYYGSWATSDNLTPGRYTIGDSHIRYWLPLYIFSLPFVASAILKIINLKKSAIKILAGLFVIIFVALSFYTLFYRDEESLVAVENNILSYKEIAAKVFSLTEANSAIITERSDKMFFPERRIITGFDTYRLMDFLPILVKKMPIYYYTFAGDGAIAKLEKEKLKPAGLDLELIQIIKDNERLFKLKLIK